MDNNPQPQRAQTRVSRTVYRRPSPSRLAWSDRLHFIRLRWWGLHHSDSIDLLRDILPDSFVDKYPAATERTGFHWTYLLKPWEAAVVQRRSILHVIELFRAELESLPTDADRDDERLLFLEVHEQIWEDLEILANITE